MAAHLDPFEADALLEQAMNAVTDAMSGINAEVLARVLSEDVEEATEEQTTACDAHMRTLFEMEEEEVTDQRFVKALTQTGRFWDPEMNPEDYRMMGTQNIWTYRKMFVRSFRVNNLQAKTMWEIFAISSYMRNKARVQMWYESNRRNLQPSLELRAAFDWIIRRTSSTPKDQDPTLPAYVKLAPSFPEMSAYAYVRVGLDMGLSVATIVRDLVKEVWLSSLALRGTARDANRNSYMVFWNTVVDRKVDGQEITPAERIARLDWYDRSAQDAIKLITPTGDYFRPESSMADGMFIGYDMGELTSWVTMVLDSVENLDPEEAPAFVPHAHVVVA